MFSKRFDIIISWNENTLSLYNFHFHSQTHKSLCNGKQINGKRSLPVGIGARCHTMSICLTLHVTNGVCVCVSVNVPKYSCCCRIWHSGDKKVLFMHIMAFARLCTMIQSTNTELYRLHWKLFHFFAFPSTFHCNRQFELYLCALIFFSTILFYHASKLKQVFGILHSHTHTRAVNSLPVESNRVVYIWNMHNITTYYHILCKNISN